MEEFGEVHLDSSLAREALDYFVSAKYITAERKEIIQKGAYY